MIEKSAKRQKKATISEQDVESLLQRYTPKTVLALLHEVSQCTESRKIDWNDLVQKTTTGISSAREYQMLWRHLAYHDTLLEKLDEDAQPMDDDSDLEFELEAFPTVNGEASAETAACVKVLIASAIPSNSNPNGSLVDAPLTINIPNSQSCRDFEQPSCSMEGTNVIIPVSVQRQPAPAATVTDGLDKRKRKQWSDPEDLELIAAVQKCGEGNWAHMLRGDFKGDRTASQLAQRWGIIRKRHVNVNTGTISTAPQLSESQMATSHALHLALDMPVNNLTSNTIGRGGTVAYRPSGTNSRSNSAKTNGTNNSQPVPSAAENSTAGNKLTQSQKLSRENHASTKPSPPVGSSGAAEKPCAPAKKTILKPAPAPTPTPTPTPNSSDAMVRAAAVAAGARIVSPSDAESLLKAAQAKNAVHIMPSSGGSIISSMPGGVSSSISEALPNVHYIRTGLARPPLSNYAAATPSIPVKAVPSQVKPLPTTDGTSLDAPLKQNNDANSTPASEAPSKDVKTIVPEAGSAQGNGACVVQDGKVASSVPSSVLKGTSGTANPISSMNLKTAGLNGSAVSPSNLKTAVLKSVSVAKNSVGSLNLRTVDAKGTAGTQNPVNLKTADLKGTSVAPNPVSSSTSKPAEVKSTNGTPNPVRLLTSKTAEVKSTDSTPNPVRLSTSKTAEVKSANGAPKPVSVSTSKTPEVKGGTSGAPKPVTLSTSKTAEVKGTNGAPKPVILQTSKTAEVKGTNGAPRSVILSTLKMAEVKGMNGAPRPVILSTSKTAEVKGTNGAPKPVILSTSKTAEVKSTVGSPSPVSLLTSKTVEVKSAVGAPNPISMLTSKTAEVKSTVGAPNPVSLLTSKKAEVKCTSSTPKLNPVNLSALKTAENSKQAIINPQPKKAEESVKGNMGSGSQPKPCDDKGEKVEQKSQSQRVEKMNEDRPSVAKDGEKEGENEAEKMEVDVPEVVTAVEKSDKNQGVEKMEEDLPR